MLSSSPSRAHTWNHRRPLDHEAEMKRTMEKSLDQKQRPASSIRRHLTNATLGRLTETLAQLLQRPVIDLTSVSGKYNIDLDLPAPESNDDSLECRVSRALSRFGLKLESRKLPAAVLVVDSVSKAPTAN